MKLDRKILFVTYGGGHIAMVLPVMQALEQMGIDCQLMALTTAGARARQAGVAYVGYRDFMHLVDREAVLAQGDRWLNGNQHPDVDLLETRSYLGINYCEWVETFGEEKASAMMHAEGRRAFSPRRFMDLVIGEMNPMVVVTTNSPRSEQAAIEAAVFRGIPTLSMIDLFALDYDPYLQRKIHADRIAVLSESVCEKLGRAGIELSRIRVTGNPAFDGLMQPENLRIGQEFRALMGWQRHTVVLWAGHIEDRPETPPQWRDEKFGLMVERMLRDWVASNTHAALIIRYHPNESHRFPQGPPQDNVYISDPAVDPIYKVLLACDAAVVQTTTVGLEGAVAGRNVFSLSFSPLVRFSGLDYARLGLAHAVDSPQDLVPMLERYARAPVAALGRFNAGHASQAVAREVVALMQEGSRPEPFRV